MKYFRANNRIILVFISVIIAAIIGVNGQCSKLIPSYHECFNSETSTGLVVEFNNDYYRSQLEPIRSFDEAMNLFRAYYQILSTCDTSNHKCDCFRAKMSGEPDYGLLFTNASHFNDVKRLVRPVKLKYRLRQLKEINRDLLVDGQQPFASSLPHLNGFCLKYDYSYQMEFFYDALKSCKSSGNTLALVACMPTSIFSSDSQEKFLACTYSYRDCALELKSFLALADMARYPQLVDEKDLYVYVHSLTSNAASSTSTHVRFIQLALVVIISIVGGGSGGYTGI